MSLVGPKGTNSVAPSTRLHLRFAAATAAVIATAGCALLWYVRHQEITQAERNVTVQARFVAKSILRDELKPTDLAGPVRGPHLKELDSLFRDRILVDSGLRVKIYRAGDGLVTYSNVHSLIGTKIDSLPELNDVLGGAVVRDISYINHEGGTGSNVKALEVYVPLKLKGDLKPSGVFEIYESYAPVASTVRSFVLPFTGLLLLTLIAMWAALFPLVQRMVRAVARDRTARQTAELALAEASEQLRQAQKMDAIGRLAGGVAHDFNNLLLAITGYADFLIASLTDPKQKHYAEEIQAAAERAAALTHQLLAVSRRQVLQTRVVDLNDCVRELETMLRRLIGEGVHVALELEPHLRPVEADPSQMGQVLLNLAVNARDALAGGGTLTIATRNDGDDVVLEVDDDGAGMDDETRARLFEPFFTTKDIGLGTGLGLSTVYGIVTQSGGSIDVRSEPGLGATFTVRLPFTTASVEEILPAELNPAGGHERILVVDDEKVVRELLAQMLRERGYEVEVAGSARDARALGGRWDLLLTDVVMPDTDGVKLSKQIDARHVLFISGYDQEALVAGDASFLQKPFSRDELTRTVRALFDAAPVPAGTFA
ncbi:MAG: two-component system, cell cycle sensor histidine kinase and response regulator CckA [Gaiellaceae bacterium]|nr:two-component system, cell cycle sensor histidine kinase and response regulator CckA [Gaiellaceae bacterium]